jgi:MFS family permease
VEEAQHEPPQDAQVGVNQRFAIGSSTFLYWLSYTTLRPLMAPYLVGLGARLPVVGFAIGIQAVPGLLMSIPLGHVTDRYGARAPIGLGGAGMALGVAILFAVPSVAGVVGGQLVFGAGAIATWVGIQAGLVALTKGPGEQLRLERVRNISRNSLFMAAGQVLGPTVGGLLTDRYGIRAAFGLVIGATLAVALTARFLDGPPSRARASEPPPASPADEVVTGPAAAATPPATQEAPPRSGGSTDFKDGVAEILRSRGVVVAMLASFLALFLLDIRTSFHPVYLDSIDFSSTEIGIVLSVGAACMFIARPLLPVLSRHLRDRTILLIVIGIGAWAIGSVVFTTSFAVILLLSLVAGTTLGLSQPFTLMLIAEYAPSNRGGLGVGFRMVANRSAHLLAPIALGSLIGLLGIVWGFMSVTVGVTLIGLWCAALMTGLEGEPGSVRPRR